MDLSKERMYSNGMYTVIKRTSEYGIRYEICKNCGAEWNIAKGQHISKAGYVCPVCTNRKRKGKEE